MNDYLFYDWTDCNRLSLTLLKSQRAKKTFSVSAWRNKVFIFSLIA